MKATIQRVLVIGIIFLIILAYSANQLLFSQNSSQLSLSPLPLETIKIVNPITTQNVGTGQELIITGVSSDNALKNCAVSVIVNDVRPYQAAFAKGTDGKNDYSQWEFVLRTNYTQIIEGENKITSKLSCTSAPPRWYSVSVNGVPNYSNEEMLSPVQTEEQQNIPTTNLSETSDIDGNNNVLLVSIFPLKNSVARGDSQNTTITVTDSASKPVPNAEIDGNLIYPGDNYEKEFSGITDSQGKFVYSWIIGENGDVGPLSIEVEVSSQGYPSVSATSSFEIVDSSEASGINNDSDDPFD
ncbi:MAG: hypothetical protein QOK70_03080 [Nitrososphaeraceae archaeon]|nr:hypothetical protein [Nitrososphaeraceae archaeon]